MCIYIEETYAAVAKYFVQKISGIYYSRKQTLHHADGIETCVYPGDDLFQIVSWTLADLPRRFFRRGKIFRKKKSNQHFFMQTKLV